jgi:hypothetical protein
MIIRYAEKGDIAEINKLLYQVHKIHADARPDLFVQNEKKYSDKDLMITDDDAVVAIVRLRFDPTDALDWFFTKGSHQTSLDQWFLDQEIERENALTTIRDPKVSWAEYAGLMMGDDGDYVEDTSDDYDDIDWRNDTGDAFSHMRGYR